MEDLINKIPKISRRKFVIGAGGFTFLITTGAIWPKLSSEDKSAGEDGITAWVHLRSDGKIVIYNPAAEMGQGSKTALPVLIAEEMDVDWSTVIIENSPIITEIYGSRAFGRQKRMITVGSRAVSSYFESLRQAGAQARYVLLYNVAQKWNVPIHELTTDAGVVIHKSSGKKMLYAEIAEFAKSPDKIPEIPTEQLKKPSQFRLIGKNIPRVDIPSKVNGSAIFAIDIQLPGMVYGAISRTPVNGAKPLNVLNKDSILEIEGVLDLVTLEHGVGVIANSMETAFKAKKSLQIQWSKGVKAENYNSIEAFEKYVSIAGDAGVKGRTIKNEGNTLEALQNAEKTFSSDYKNDFAYHAQMEPLNAVVSVSDDGSSAELWVGSQAPASARSAAAKALGLDESKVEIHHCYLGGGFGRRSMSGYVSEAATLAKKAGKPLKLVWTREDDIAYGAFRPMSVQRMQAGVDKIGNIVGWSHTVVGTGSRLMTSGVNTLFYTFPNQHIEMRNVDEGVRTKHWRGVGHGPNKFAIEAFIDEISIDQNIDPFEMRRRLMKNHPRALNVLETVAKMANWGDTPPPGRGRGVAFAERSGSLTAGVCELSVNKESGRIQVHKFWVALDAGIVVQPNNVLAQTEGSVNFGLSSVLSESLTFKKGKVQQSNFHDYNVLRIADAPESIEIKIIPSNEKPSGVGEAALPFVGGAVSNAFANLTGKRLRHIPFTPEKVLDALNS